MNAANPQANILVVDDTLANLRLLSDMLKHQGHKVRGVTSGAMDDVADKVKAFEAGGVDYITKPIEQEEVLARVATHLQLRRLQLRLEKRTEQLERGIQELDGFARTGYHTHVLDGVVRGWRRRLGSQRGGGQHEATQ